MEWVRDCAQLKFDKVLAGGGRITHDGLGDGEEDGGLGLELELVLELELDELETATLDDPDGDEPGDCCPA